MENKSNESEMKELKNFNNGIGKQGLERNISEDAVFDMTVDSYRHVKDFPLELVLLGCRKDNGDNVVVRYNVPKLDANDIYFLKSLLDGCNKRNVEATITAFSFLVADDGTEMYVASGINIHSESESLDYKDVFEAMELSHASGRRI